MKWLKEAFFDSCPECQRLQDDARDAIQLMVRCREISRLGGEPENMFIIVESEATVNALLECYQRTSNQVVIASLLPECKDRDVVKSLLTNSGLEEKKKWKNCSQFELFLDLKSMAKSERVEQFILTGLQNYVGTAKPAGLYHKAELIVSIVNATRCPCVLFGQKGAGTERLLKENERLAGRFMIRRVLA